MFCDPKRGLNIIAVVNLFENFKIEKKLSLSNMPTRIVMIH